MREPLVSAEQLHAELHAEIKRLRAVNDALKSKSVLGTAYASALEDLEATRKLLAWHEARDPSVRRLRDTLHNVVASEWSKEAANDECAFFDDWESDNPKPEGGK